MLQRKPLKKKQQVAKLRIKVVKPPEPRRVYLYPYKLGSAGAKALAQLLGAKRIKEDSKPRRSGLVINWGKSTTPQFSVRGWHNYPEAVTKACNKIDTLRALKNANVPHVDWTCDRGVAAAWLHNKECKLVYCRTNVRGYGGVGISLARTQDELVPAPLYTKGVKKDREFRIHVMNSQVIFQQEKKMMAKDRRPGNFNANVRNHANGWVFTDQNIQLPQQVIDVAIAAVRSLGLDFGAVDVIWNDELGAFVLEVNTAIGMQPKLAQIYASKIKEFYLNAL